MQARRFIAIGALALALAPQVLPAQTLIPIDPSLFTIQSSPGIATWTGNSLTLNLAVAGPTYGGFTQAPRLPISVLPKNIIGISFNLSTTLARTRLSFGMPTYTSLSGANDGYQDVILFNYGPGNSSDLSSFTKRTLELTGPATDYLDEPLGANYNPFSLLPSGQATQPFQDVAKSFSLDFRADGFDAITGLRHPGSVSFNNINWIVAPEPTSIVLVGIGLMLCVVPFGWRVRREHRTIRNEVC